MQDDLATHLWMRILERTQHALRCGALRPLSTRSEFVEEEGIRFLVRILTERSPGDEAGEKQKAEKIATGKEPNPFLPYEQDLFVADVSATHLCLLNKFNVADHHLLIVTRHYEDQESVLTLQDFEAMWTCLVEFEGLAFYNAGRTAGASQPHKHLQLVPLPFASTGPAIPIVAALETARFSGPVGTVPNLPFKHAVIRLDPHWARSPLEAARATFECYDLMLEAMGLHSDTGSGPPGPYNLLVAREWMLLVPRSRKKFASIPINALGFAGAFLLRSPQQMQTLKAHGPLNLLRGVAVPSSPAPRSDRRGGWWSGGGR
jgi:ATP adenylyltransferase